MLSVVCRRTQLFNSSYLEFNFTFSTYITYFGMLTYFVHYCFYQTPLKTKIFGASVWHTMLLLQSIATMSNWLQSLALYLTAWSAWTWSSEHRKHFFHNKPAGIVPHAIRSNVSSPIFGIHIHMNEHKSRMKSKKSFTKTTTEAIRIVRLTAWNKMPSNVLWRMFRIVHMLLTTLTDSR